MNKRTFIITVFILIALVAGGAYLYLRQVQQRIVLEMKTASSETTFTLYPDGSARFTEKDGSTTQEPLNFNAGTFTRDDIDMVHRSLLTNNFSSLHDALQQSESTSGDALFTLSTGGHTVRCYKTTCDPAFQNIIDALAGLWKEKAQQATPTSLQ
ncbi:MAG: hypothetical protein KGI50_03635 [Patescibacteria group bacterium]|nr:hypothetical protein [Patescibacteria group bacterium]MDE2438382.1 hypothetical protein [Patescibacteria group bacterium]